MSTLAQRTYEAALTMWQNDTRTRRPQREDFAHLDAVDQVVPAPAPAPAQSPTPAAPASGAAVDTALQQMQAAVDQRYSRGGAL